MKQTNRSLFSQFVRETVLILAAVASLSFLAIIISFAVIERINTENTQDSVSQVLSQGLTAAVWHYDVRAIDDTISAYTVAGQVEFALIVDKYGMALSDLDTNPPSRAPDNTIPIISEFDDIAAHLNIWWVMDGPNWFIANRSAMLGALILFAIVAATSGTLIRRSLRQHIIIPLKSLEAELTSNQQSTSGQLSHISITHEFSAFRDSFESMKQQVAQERERRQIAYIEKENALRIQQRSAAALNTLFEVVGQTIIIVDDNNVEIASRISRPFSIQHHSQLLSVTSKPERMGVMLNEIGAQQLRSLPSTTDRQFIEFRMQDNTLFLCSSIQLEKGHAFIVSDITAQSNTEAALDEILDATKTGIAFVSKMGNLRNERGAPIARLYDGNHQKNNELPSPIVSAIHGITDETNVKVGQHYYQLNTVRLRSGLICVSHTDVTHIREIERVMQRDQHLKSLGQLSSGIAHDFNNILGIIIGNLEIIESQTPTHLQQRLREATQAATTGASTIGHLLAYSKKKPLLAEKIHVDTLLEENLALLRSAAGQSVTIHMDTHSDLLVKIDKAMFVTAILNLVVNARDAMNGIGQINISTNAVQRNHGGNIIQIIVQDSGPGIPIEIAKDIFDPYFSTKQQSLGTGLGLSMVKGFIESSGGVIRQKNTSIGARFTLEITALPQNTCLTIPSLMKPRKSEIGIIEPAEASISTSAIQKSVLVVDDEEPLLNINRHILELMNYDVTTFSNPEDAIKWLAKNNPIDLLVTDFTMPLYSGVDIVRLSKAQLDNIPVLLCSGNLTEDILQKGRDAGIQHFIEKPYSLSKLQKTVTEIFATHEKVN